MGKIKSKLVRRTAKGLKENKIKFNTNFKENKKVLGNSMPSKKVRNQIAGLLVRTEKQALEEKKKLNLKK